MVYMVRPSEKPKRGRRRRKEEKEEVDNEQQILKAKVKRGCVTLGGIINLSEPHLKMQTASNMGVK